MEQDTWYKIEILKFMTDEHEGWMQSGDRSYMTTNKAKAQRIARTLSRQPGVYVQSNRVVEFKLVRVPDQEQ